MLKFIRSPQGLVTLSVLTAIVGSLIIIFIVIQHFDAQFNKPIIVAENLGATITVDTEAQGYGINYNQKFEVTGGEVHIKWQDNQAVVLGPATLLINSNKAEIYSGIIYLDITKPNLINIFTPEKTLEINTQQITLVYDSTQQQAVILSGAGVIDKAYGKNEYIKIVGENITSDIFRKEALNGNTTWNKVASTLEAFSIFEPWLEDRTPPQITSVSPDPAIPVTADQSSIDFELVVDDPGTKLTINGTTGVVQDNKFSTRLNLIKGENIINILLSDEWGNRSIVRYTYFKGQDQGGGEEVAINSSCEDSSFRTELIGMINSYRQKNGKAPLRLDLTLSSVSCDHSRWMESSGTVSHIGLDGKTFSDRCQGVSKGCKAENLIHTLTNVSPQLTMELWQNNTEYNNNLLGNYTIIGIGQYDDYVTTVFN